LKQIDSHADKFVTSLLAVSAEPWYAELAKTLQWGGSNADEHGPLISDAIKGKPNLRLAQEDEGFVVATPVNYVVKGGGLFDEGEHISGTTDVVVSLISQQYMWDKVRVMGGAYGGGCSVSHLSGTFMCYSYRDPNLKSTLDIFDDVASFLEKLKLTDAEVEQLVIGAVGKLDGPISPESKGYSSMVRWLVNNKLENRKAHRAEMLATKVASFADVAKRLRQRSGSFKNSIFGSSKSFEKANKALGGKAIPLTKLQ